MNTLAVQNKVRGYSSSPKISKFYRKISGMSTWKPIVSTLIKCISKDLSLTKIVNFTDKDFVFAVF